MNSDPDGPVTLTTAAHEIEAAAIIGYLEQCGIKAISAGGYTSGFKAEAPGNVAVLVRRADLARARQALEEMQNGG
jgi:hypothetical protein